MKKDPRSGLTPYIPRKGPRKGPRKVLSKLLLTTYKILSLA